MYYNEELALERGVSEEDRLELDETYKDLFFAFDNPQMFPDIELVVQNLEYKLQGLWGFPQDPKFHRYQQYIKDCTCPMMDNNELVGYDAQRYRMSNCPWHNRGFV
jgi:hypothetical protein